LFRLLAKLHNWDPIRCSYFTLVQALLYVEPEEDEQEPAFKKSKKFKTKADVMAFLNRGKK
jgi:hypothetical protein|tara:strand:- start:704 stop:886 length:183 start_codon:yes stop_codon:yes gene_type:complete